MGELGDIGQATKERPFGNVSSVKARVLIYSHLDRLTLPSYEVQHGEMPVSYFHGKCFFFEKKSKVHTST